MSKQAGPVRYNPLPRYVGYREVCDALGCSRSTLERMVRDGRFPKPVQLTPNRVGWEASVVEADLAKRAKGLAAQAVADPENLAADDIVSSMHILASRIVSEHVGKTVGPEHIRLFLQEQSGQPDHAVCRAQLLECVERLCGHFTGQRAYIIAASLFPAIREHMSRQGVLPFADDPESLRELAIECLDDEAWADFEAFCESAEAKGR